MIIKRFPGEDDDKFLKRFKKMIDREGIVTEVRDRKYFDKKAQRLKKNRKIRRDLALKNLKREKERGGPNIQ